MNRRLAVKNVAVLVATTTLLPSCFSQSEDGKQDAAPPTAVNASQQLLAEVCEAIIPKTATPGAKDLGLHLYVLKMLKDCTPEKEQALFMAGLKQLDGAAKQAHGQVFEASTAAQRLALLQRIDQQPGDFSVELTGFYRMARQLTADGYKGSKYFMTKEVVYELVPGRYNGYYPVSKVNLAIPHHGQS